MGSAFGLPAGLAGSGLAFGGGTTIIGSGSSVGGRANFGVASFKSWPAGAGALGTGSSSGGGSPGWADPSPAHPTSATPAASTPASRYTLRSLFSPRDEPDRRGQSVPNSSRHTFHRPGVKAGMTRATDFIGTSLPVPPKWLNVLTWVGKR